MFSSTLSAAVPKIVVMACWDSSTTGYGIPSRTVAYPAMRYDTVTQHSAAICVVTNSALVTLFIPVPPQAP